MGGVVHFTIKKQIAEDLDRRSLNGSYIYLAAWLVIGWGSGFYLNNGDEYWGLAAILAALGALRVALYLYSPRLRKRSVLQWLLGICICTLGSASIFSYLLCFSLFHPAYQSMHLYLLVAVFAMISGGALNLSPLRRLSTAYLLTFVVPPLYSIVFYAAERYVEGMLLVVYAVFMYLQAMRLNQEYDNMLGQQEALQDITHQDSLTGIANRRFFDKSLKLAWKTHQRSQSKLVLMIIDVDFFKQVNDEYGHAAGDEVIRSIASTIQNTCKRQTDIVARIGGEEFAVLYSSDDDASVKVLAESLRGKISSLSIEYEEQSIYVTASIGLAVMIPSLELSEDKLFRCADRNLYRAKEAGRNQVVFD